MLLAPIFFGTITRGCRRRGRVVRQRFAKPCTPVQIRSSPQVSWRVNWYLFKWKFRKKNKNLANQK